MQRCAVKLFVARLELLSAGGEAAAAAAAAGGGGDTATTVEELRDAVTTAVQHLHAAMQVTSSFDSPPPSFRRGAEAFSGILHAESVLCV